MGTVVGHDRGRAGDQHRRPDRAPAGDQALQRRGKRHLRTLPRRPAPPTRLLINGVHRRADLRPRLPRPDPVQPRHLQRARPAGAGVFNGSGLEALFPLSLLLQGNALNITCVSHAGTLNFGFTGARDRLPTSGTWRSSWARRSEELDRILLGGGKAKRRNAPAHHQVRRPNRAASFPPTSGKRPARPAPRRRRAASSALRQTRHTVERDGHPAKAPRRRSGQTRPAARRTLS